MTPSRWTEDEVARRVAQDLAGARLVNLGIGLPTLVAQHIQEPTLVHSENGIVGVGPPAKASKADPDLIDAGKRPITLVAGAAIMDHVESFTLIRGGRLDVTVLGAFQVSRTGDLANWTTQADGTGSVGGAMDLAIGARARFAMMRHVDRQGRPKVVEKCTLPLTAPSCVNRIYTDMAVLMVRSDGLVVLDMAPGVTESALQAVTGTSLLWR